MVLGASTAAMVAAAPAQAEEASIEERLADAQRRLEEAAREVAELSGEAAGDDAYRAFEYFVPGRRRAMLGVNIGGTEPGGGGVRVESVSPGGPAEEAGVKAGDVIVAVGSTPVATGRALVEAMNSADYYKRPPAELRADQERAAEIEKLQEDKLERWTALEAK